MRKSSKVLRLVVLVVLIGSVLVSSSCTLFQTPNIGISTSDEIGMTKKVIDDVMTMAEEDGYPVTLLSANGTYETQEMHIASFIEQELNVIAICSVNLTEVLRSIDAANTAGIPVVLFEKPIDGADVSFFAGYNAAEEGRIAAKAIAEADDGKENFVVEIIGPEDNPNAINASKGFHEEIDTVNNITVIQVVSNWNIQSAYEGMKSILKKYPTISAIYCSNSTLDKGVDAALDEIGLLKPVGAQDHIFRVSVSGSKNGYDSAAEGYVDVLLATDVDSESKALYDALVTLGSGKKLEKTSFIASSTLYSQDELALNKNDIWGYVSGIE